MLYKVRRLSWPERWGLLEALIWLGLMQLTIRLLPFRSITRLLKLTLGEDHKQFAGVQADRIGWSIRAVATHTPWKSTCLAQALAGIAMLNRHGIPGTLYLGVAKGADESEPVQFAAHAWLSSGEKILVGGGVHERFNTIAAFTHHFKM